MESYVIMLMESFLKVVKKFSVFTGRSGRREFWMFMLCNLIIGVVLGILSSIPFLGGIFKLVTGLFSLAVLIPAIAVSIRRLHDTNRSGYFVLLGLVPFIGAVVLLALCAMEGTPDENKYGPNPKEITEA